MTSPDGIPSSKFAMFRCMIALAHADGVLHKAERDYMLDMLAAHRLSADQRQIVNSDFELAPPVAELLPQITEPVYRSQVLHFARLMAHRDGVLDPTEQDVLDKIEAHIMKGVDMAALRAEVQKVVDADLRLHDIKSGENRFFCWLRHFFDRILPHAGH